MKITSATSTSVQSVLDQSDDRQDDDPGDTHTSRFRSTCALPHTFGRRRGPSAQVSTSESFRIFLLGMLPKPSDLGHQSSVVLDQCREIRSNVFCPGPTTSSMRAGAIHNLTPVLGSILHHVADPQVEVLQTMLDQVEIQRERTSFFSVSHVISLVHIDIVVYRGSCAARTFDTVNGIKAFNNPQHPIRIFLAGCK